MKKKNKTEAKDATGISNTRFNLESHFDYSPKPDLKLAEKRKIQPKQ